MPPASCCCSPCCRFRSAPRRPPPPPPPRGAARGARPAPPPPHRLGRGARLAVPASRLTAATTAASLAGLGDDPAEQTVAAAPPAAADLLLRRAVPGSGYPRAPAHPVRHHRSARGARRGRPVPGTRARPPCHGRFRRVLRDLCARVLDHAAQPDHGFGQR